MTDTKTKNVCTFEEDMLNPQVGECPLEICCCLLSGIRGNFSAPLYRGLILAIQHKRQWNKDYDHMFPIEIQTWIQQINVHNLILSTPIQYYNTADTLLRLILTIQCYFFASLTLLKEPLVDACFNIISCNHFSLTVYFFN